jgi:heme-degrading monooxygenase HmoA
VIARIWRGWVATEQAADYVGYIERTGIAEYRQTPGNLGAQMLTRDLGDGRTEVLTLSWWTTVENIRGFAGDDIDVAKFYPEDDEYLVDRETTVAHYQMASSALP